MPIFLAVFLFAAVLSMTAGFGYYYYAKPSQLLDQLTSAARTKPRYVKKKPQAFTFSELLKFVGELFPVSPQDAKLLKQDLIAAGIRSDSAIQVFYGIKLVAAVVFLIFGILGRDRVQNSLRLGPGHGECQPRVEDSSRRDERRTGAGKYGDYGRNQPR